MTTPGIRVTPWLSHYISRIPSLRDAEASSRRRGSGGSIPGVALISNPSDNPDVSTSAAFWAHPSPRTIVLLAIVIAFVLRLHHLAFQSFWRDEIDAVLFASQNYHKLGQMYLRVGDNGPFYFTLLHLWLLWGGHSDFAIRYSSVLAGVATVPLLYSATSRLVNPPAGVIAALLLAINPYHVWYSQETKMYALVVFFAVLSMNVLIRAIDAAGWTPWYLWLMTTVAGIYTHFFFALLVGAEIPFIIWALVSGRRGGRRGIGCILAMGLADLPFARWQIPLLLHGLATSYPVVSPATIASILLTKFSLGIGPPSTTEIVLFAFISLTGLLLAAPKTPTVGQIIGATWLILPILFYVIVSLRIAVFLDRYLIIVLPPFIIFMSRGILVLMNQSRVGAIGLLAAAGLILVPRAWNQPLLKQDFRDAAAYVESHSQKDDTLLFIPSWENTYFGYYDHEHYRWIAVPSVDQSGIAPAVKLVKESFDLPHATLWLVSVEPQYADRNLKLQAWLDRHTHLISDTRLANLDLRRYAGPVH